MTEYLEELKTDVLVIGGGAAGCWAALKASEGDLDVTLMNQYTFGKSGTTIVAMITYQAVMGELGRLPQDSEDTFFEDIARGGAYLGEQNLIEILVRQSKKTVLEYEQLGVKWDKIDGKFDSKGLPGMTHPRGCFVDHRTGLALQRALVRAVQKRRNIRYVEGKVIKLLTADGCAAGALAYLIPTGAFLKISARSVVLATGGAGRLYKVTSMPEDARGDGMALAFKAGVDLMDMEFHLFFPTTLPYPESLQGLVVPRGTTVPEGARILNGKGERFMHHYYPEAEYATRDKSSIAIMKEIRKGNGTPHGGVYMDLSRVKDLLKRWPTSFKDFKEAGINLPDEWLEVCPGHHFSIGGVRINSFCETTMPGLYAAGEVAANLHGANRVGGTALPECSVFGQIAGTNAALYATFRRGRAVPNGEVREEIKRIKDLQARGQKGEARPIGIIRDLRNLMYEKVGVIRDEDGLRQAREAIDLLEEKAADMSITQGKIYNKELVDAIDLENMLLLAKIITKSALKRKESRGSHHRTDYPQQDDRKWRMHIVTRLEGTEIKLRKMPVTLTRGI
ncbi:MAG: FAD-binding protein [Deltaproteobacteria bacterium]|nr:FAD-binding protein [Deltaproteobacteria bacterium]